MMVPAYTSVKEDEAERLWVQGLPGLYNKSLFLKKKKLRDVVYSVVHCLPSHKGLNSKQKKQTDREKGGRQGEGLRRKGWGNGKLSSKYLSNEI